MRQLLRICPIAFAACLLISTSSAYGQDLGMPPAYGEDVAAGELDFRVGGLWPEESASSRPSLGARMGLYLWSGPTSRRFSVQITGDYRSLGYQPVVYDDVADTLRRRRTALAIGGGVGFDVVRTSRMAIEVRGSAMFMRHRTSLQVRTRQSSIGDDVWEPICHFQGFDDDCHTEYDVSPAIAIGGRRYFGADDALFAGIDYTRIVNGYNLLVGTFGIRFR